MAIIEIALPILKPETATNPATVEDLTRNVVPVFIQALSKAGCVRGLRGFFSSEDGRDVSSEWREVLLLEWPTQSHFHQLLQSPGFLEFGNAIRPYVKDFPPQLKLFEANEGLALLAPSSSSSSSSSDSAPASVVEILDLRPRRAGTEKEEEEEEGLMKKKKKMAEDVAGILGEYRKEKEEQVIDGMSLNLDSDKEQIVIISGFADREAYESANKKVARQEFLAALRTKANVTQLVADVERIPFDGGN